MLKVSVVEGTATKTQRADTIPKAGAGIPQCVDLLSFIKAIVARWRASSPLGRWPCSRPRYDVRSEACGLWEAVASYGRGLREET